MSELIGVTGANGWVGGTVCAWLETHCYEVRRLGRGGGDFRTVTLDLTTPESSGAWHHALKGITTLVHCAAHVHRPNETAAEVTLFRQVNIEGMARLVAAGKGAGVRRIVFVGSAAVYDWAEAGPAATESSPTLAATAYARSKLEAERIVRDSGLDWRIARLGTVFGAGDRANFRRLAQGLKRRCFVVPGPGSARKSVLEVRQAAEVLGRLALLPEVRDKVVNVASPYVPTLLEICAALSDACGVPAPRCAPLSVMKIVARVGDGLAKIAGNAPFTSEVLRKLITPTVLDTGLLVRLFPDIKWKSFRDSLQDSRDYYGKCK